jgi:hypothetical protein
LIEAVNADNLDDKVEEYFSFQQSPSPASLKHTLLLDSCSSINLICNEELLHNISTVKKTMHVRCNSGVKSTNQQGYLGEFPEAVWLNPNGAANILLLNSVKKYYRVQYDSSGDDAFVVSNNDGQSIRFTPTSDGLYATSTILTTNNYTGSF